MLAIVSNNKYRIISLDEYENISILFRHNEKIPVLIYGMQVPIFSAGVIE